MARLRRADPEECALLSAIAFRSKAFWGYDAAFMEACRAELTYTESQVRDRFFGVIEEEKIIGFYALKPHGQSEVELDALFVLPEEIGKGYGRALMEHAKSKAVEMGAARMIIQSDPNARDFYEAAGGVCTGQRESVSIPGRSLPLFEIGLR